ncbi:MAG: hypothetical protein ACYS67_00710 [Planctomycetota bacterium]|jgi:hypothetical protein
MKNIVADTYLEKDESGPPAGETEQPKTEVGKPGLVYRYIWIILYTESYSVQRSFYVA